MVMLVRLKCTCAGELSKRDTGLGDDMVKLLWLDMQLEKGRAGFGLDDDVVYAELMIETCLDRERSAANLLLVSFSINGTTDVTKEETQETGR